MAITLSMHQQFGQLGMRTSSRRFDLQRTPPDLSIEQRAAELNLTISQGQVSIDMTQMQNSLGYGGIDFTSQNAVAEARQIFDMDLAQSVQGGDALAQLHRKMSIGELAAQARFFDHSLPEVALEYIEPPEIHYEPGEVISSGELGQIKINATMGKVEVLNFEPAVVTTYLESEPLLDITTKGWAFDFKV